MRDIPIFSAKPSKRLVALVDVYGSISKAATAWGLEYQSLRRFFEGRGGLSGGYVATIVERTGLAYEDLFEHVKEAK